MKDQWSEESASDEWVIFTSGDEVREGKTEMGMIFITVGSF